MTMLHYFHCCGHGCRLITRSTRARAGDFDGCWVWFDALHGVDVHDAGVHVWVLLWGAACSVSNNHAIVAPSGCPSKMRHTFLLLLNEVPTVVYSLSKFNKLHVPVLYPISIWREKRHHPDVVLIQMTRFESCFDIGCLSNKKTCFSHLSVTYRHLAAISIGLLMWRLTLLVTPSCPLQSSGRTQTWPSRSPRTDSTRKSLISQVFVCYLLRCFSNRTRVAALVS